MLVGPLGSPGGREVPAQVQMVDIQMISIDTGSFGGCRVIVEGHEESLEGECEATQIVLASRDGTYRITMCER